MNPLLSSDKAEVFYGGMRAVPRLNHPEGILIAPDGAIWCGGEQGELYRISSDGLRCDQVARTGGFALGLCIDQQGLIYVCDLIFKVVIVFDQSGRELRRLVAKNGHETLQLPNYAVFDPGCRHLYVSDTRENGPGIWRFDMQTDQCILWMKENCLLANGLAMAPDGRSIYMVESAGNGVFRIPIREDGSAGKKELAVALPEGIPDGIAFDSRGRLYISNYHPTRIYRVDGNNSLQLVIDDPLIKYMHHTTNIAFRGDQELFCTNFGAWHICRISLDLIG
jgi:gluconolactonase